MEKIPKSKRTTFQRCPCGNAGIKTEQDHSGICQRCAEIESNLEQYHPPLNPDREANGYKS